MNKSQEIKGLSLIIPAQTGIRNYYDWIFDTIGSYLGRRVIEIGPGYGSMAERIVPRSERYAGLDISADVIEHLKEKFGGEKHASFRQGSLAGNADPNLEKELVGGGYDTVFMMNVLEHIEDMAGFLKAVGRCAPKARVVILAPAGKMLYGSIDREAGHFLRFEKKDVAELFSKAGITGEKVFYFNFFGAIGWFVANRIMGVRIHDKSSGAMARLFDRYAIPVIRTFDKMFSSFYGQSIIAVGKFNE
ncbi:MAG: class I SAM-dependent methyltransferase [Endomicrobiales bacterium]|nr:class I SAM-dependent methyltransferase [Endomicrobiales bacterium]